MASIIHHVKEAGGVVAVNGEFDKLLVEASKVDTLDKYDAFAKK